MVTSTVPKYTVLDWELGYIDCVTPTLGSQYQFHNRCIKQENVTEPVKKLFPGVPLSDV